MGDYGLSLWQPYEKFAELMRSRNRFVPTPWMRSFLGELASTSARRTIELGAGLQLFRAQEGCVSDGAAQAPPILGFFLRRRQPLLPERMIPDPAKITMGGRGNPPGIAYLYLADSRETAVAEIRPWVGAFVTVASFELVRKLRLLDLTLFPPSLDQRPISASTSLPPIEEIDLTWAYINVAFSTPVNSNDSQLDYIPTQYLAEFFREQLFDGLLYKSTLKLPDGKNYMLFDRTAATVGDAEVVCIKGVHYELVDASRYGPTAE